MTELFFLGNKFTTTQCLKRFTGSLIRIFFFLSLGKKLKKLMFMFQCMMKGKGFALAIKIDLNANQKEPWAINVDGEDYFLNPGDALLYSGTDHWHYREKIQENNFCDLAFFHFVPINFEGELL